MTLRTVLPAIIAIAAFSGCVSAYRTGQTPDDVYYSPAREGAAYAQIDQRRDGRGSYRNNDYYSYDDRWLRMRVANRYRWSAFDDYDWYDWRYNTWSYHHYSPYYWNTYWNNYYYWNSWYNPYYGSIIVVNPKTNPVVYGKVRDFSLSSYTNTNYNNTNAARRFNRPKGQYSNGARYNNSNSRYDNNNNSLGSSIRKIFSGSGSNGNSSRSGSYSPGSERPTRTYTPPPSSTGSSSRSGGSSGSSGGSSGGGVSRPSRGSN